MTTCTREFVPVHSAPSAALSADPDSGHRQVLLLQLIRDNRPKKLWQGLEGCLQKVIELARLEQGWDGYDSPPIDMLCLGRALALCLGDSVPDEAPTPLVAPVPGGGVQFEWEVQGRVLELEFRPSGSTEFLIVDGDHQDEGEVGLPSPQLKMLLNWLVGR